MSKVSATYEINYNTVDLLKFIMSIFVVAIHAGFLDIRNSTIDWLISSMMFRISVPVFFVISGYFLAGKLFSLNTKDKTIIFSVLKKWCEALFIPLIFWSGLRLFINLYEYYIAGKGIVYLVSYAIRTIFYPLSAMWYIWALIIGALIVSYIYITYENWYRVWLFISIIGYVVVLACNNYYFLFDENIIGKIIKIYMKCFVSARNGIFLAPIFIGMGFVLREEKTQIWIAKHRIIPFIFMIIGYVLLYLEAKTLFKFLGMDDRGYFVSFIILIPSIVCSALIYNININLPYQLFRRLSTSIYFMHSFVLYLVKKFILINDEKFFAFIVTIVICIVVALISYCCKNKWIKKIIG